MRSRVPVPGDRIALEVTDDGRGATAEQLQRRGHGQDIMQYRANLLSAELEVQSRPEGGVRVRCVIPLEALRPERMEDEA